MSDPLASLSGVDDEDLELLRFAKKLWHHRGAQAAAIRERFGLSETAYWQRVLHLAQTVEGLQAEPMLCNRLNRGRRPPLPLRPSAPPPRSRAATAES